MEKLTITSSTLPENAFSDLLNREAALWVCENELYSPDDIQKLAHFMVLPWKVVLSELSSEPLLTEIETYSLQDNLLNPYRGYINLVASDPSTKSLPTRTLPVFLLNGRSKTNDRNESSNLTGMTALRRRLNMIGQLETSSPKRVFILGSNIQRAVQELADLWSNGFRALITCVVPNSVEVTSITSCFESIVDLSSISIVSTDLYQFLEDVTSKSMDSLPDPKIVLRVRNVLGDFREIDVTEAELIEYPFLDKFDIIKNKDLRRLNEFDLTHEDFDDFFDKSKFSWRAFAAGFPWIPDRNSIDTILYSLSKVQQEKTHQTPIYFVISEDGAGGTTFARTIAFEAAAAGYPTLLAKKFVYEVNATEVTTFQNRVLRIIKGLNNSVAENDQELETPWLFIFDREQWDGQEQVLGSFAAELARSGRPAVILKVLGTDISPKTLNLRAKELCTLRHDLEKEQVLALGKHLNRFLSPLGKSKKESDWLRFWEQHSPQDIGASIAAFWVILEFWLKGLINIGESIQGWLLEQFKEANFTAEVYQVILEIATLGIERRSVPEQLLLIPNSPNLPLSVILEDVQRKIPGLALIQQKSDAGRLWAIAHDILSRYLINAVYYDRSFMRHIGLADIQSSIELRLHMTSLLTQQTVIGEERFISYAEQFAVKTLKLDDSEGNAEFFLYWHKVLDILDAFPDAINYGNRAFIHHVAISRRRVANNPRFGATIDERRELLHKAIKQIEFALNNIDQVNSNESNLNLYNSLALAYQDLASLELSDGGVSDLVRSLWAKANEAILSALKENPTNPYVLETSAKNLLQQGKLDASENVNAASQALGYIFQATNLENSIARQRQLGKLATEALSLLRNHNSADEISRMKARKEAMGYLASAWLELMKDDQTITKASASEYPEDRVRAALEVLQEASRHWLVIQLQYELTSIIYPYNFILQLDLLDELESMKTYRLPLQQRLERAILLHMVGRHSDANNAFRDLRRDIKEQNAILSVPSHLHWLLQSDGQRKLRCTAIVVENFGYRAMAQVTELKKAQVPFTPQEFGQQKFRSGMTFKCYITFGAMGPFIKPTIE